MASKAKSRPAQKKSRSNPLADLGIFDIPSLDAGDISDDDGDESNLESELESLMRGEHQSKRIKPKPKVLAVVNIEQLAAECLKDDDEYDDDEENLSENEDLLKELQKLSSETLEEREASNHSAEKEKVDVFFTPAIDQHPPLSSATILDVLQIRLELYKKALEAASEYNDTSKIRRYGRAIKTLQSLLKSVTSGVKINEEDIPPVVNIPKLSMSTTSNNSETLQTLEDDKPLSESSSYNSNVNTSSVSSLLIARKNEYKSAALLAKKAGNKELAIKYMRTAKSFDAVIEAANNNQPVNLTNIPPSLNEKGNIDLNTQAEKVESGAQKRTQEQVQTSSALEIAALAAANEGEQSELFAAPSAPTTVLEALNQRLEKYISTKQTAESEGNSGKIRRLERIIKSYETAIKSYKAGSTTIDFDSLPTPPGFSPIPVKNDPKCTETISSEKKSVDKTPENVTNVSKQISTPKEKSVPQAHVKKPKVQRINTFTNEKQLEFLLERQKLFREAALSSKKSGDIQQAKEYLRMSKGFDSMIEATKCGLPIDTTSIPTPPQLASDFVIVDASECVESSDLSLDEIFRNLEKDMCNQLEICIRNKEHFLRLGDVSSASKFEKLALETKKDQSVILNLKKLGEVPKFHYETRLFSMVICHTDLSDNDLEVTIERGINFPGKSDDLDSFVRIELPIPNDSPQRAKTHTVRDTNNPVFGEIFKFEINRKSRSQLRLFKRHCLKLEVFSKGGFLRSDVLLGTVIIKLVVLESKCFVHESFDLMDGRKSSGGLLEVKLRIRDPLLGKQVEEVREKWLVIGS